MVVGEKPSDIVGYLHPAAFDATMVVIAGRLAFSWNIQLPLRAAISAVVSA